MFIYPSSGQHLQVVFHNYSVPTACTINAKCTQAVLSATSVAMPTHGSYGLVLQVAVLNNRGMNQKGYGRPSILALSRQGVPNLPGTSKEGVEKGGYIVHGGDEKPDAIILATGKADPC